MIRPEDSASALSRHAESILKRVRMGRWLARLPLGWAYRLGARLSPYAGHLLMGGPEEHQRLFNAWCAQVQPAALSPDAPSWRAARGSYAASLVNLARHRHRLDAIEQRVVYRSEGWAQLLAEQSSVLVLSVHNDFHHTLCALLGRGSKRVYPVVDREENSPLAPWLGQDLRAMHENCAVHFNGGRYLFLGPGVRAAITEAMGRGGLIVSLNDIEARADGASQEVRWAGRRFLAPSGSVQLALREGIPIYFAVMLWCPDQSGYHLHAERLECTLDTPLAPYYAAMDRIFATTPWGWAGWQWLNSLGKPDSAELAGSPQQL